jgi:Protein of unknown function (DUF2795)
VAEVTQRLRDVLAEQRFPAARWELIACAQHYGADVHTLRELHALPEERFRCLTDVERVVAGANSPPSGHGRADVPRGPAQQ